MLGLSLYLVIWILEICQVIIGPQVLVLKNLLANFAQQTFYLSAWISANFIWNVLSAQLAK